MDSTPRRRPAASPVGNVTPDAPRVLAPSPTRLRASLDGALAFFGAVLFLAVDRFCVLVRRR